jgi:hypothetical protein
MGFLPASVRGVVGDSNLRPLLLRA